MLGVLSFLFLFLCVCFSLFIFCVCVVVFLYFHVFCGNIDCDYGTISRANLGKEMVVVRIGCERVHDKSAGGALCVCVSMRVCVVKGNWKRNRNQQNKCRSKYESRKGVSQNEIRNAI